MPNEYQLYSAGFNAFNQLSAGPTADVQSFRQVHDCDNAGYDSILFTSWSTTVLLSSHNRSIRALGHQTIDQALPADVSLFHSAFGDHNGMHGCLDSAGRLHIVERLESGQLEVRCRSNEDSLGIAYIAEAGNGRVALAFRQASASRLCHIVEFRDFPSFEKWFADPSDEESRPEHHHMLPGRPRQLIANTATFVLLMDEGQVYTWGDSRHRSLARPTIGEEAVPANKPGLVEALGGLVISKIAAGGWMGAALSKDGVLYLWGAGNPGQEHTIKCLREAGAGQVRLVDLPSHEVDPPDVLDVSIGDNHVAVVTEGRLLAVVGDNKNGQLGLDDPVDFVEEWRYVSTINDAQHVVCGPKCTFIVAQYSTFPRELNS